jgi:hypothetical protein
MKRNSEFPTAGACSWFQLAAVEGLLAADS